MDGVSAWTQKKPWEPRATFEYISLCRMLGNLLVSRRQHRSWNQLLVGSLLAALNRRGRHLRFSGGRRGTNRTLVLRMIGGWTKAQKILTTCQPWRLNDGLASHAWTPRQLAHVNGKSQPKLRTNANEFSYRLRADNTSNAPRAELIQSKLCCKKFLAYDGQSLPAVTECTFYQAVCCFGPAQRGRFIWWSRIRIPMKLDESQRWTGHLGCQFRYLEKVGQHFANTCTGGCLKWTNACADFERPARTGLENARVFQSWIMTGGFCPWRMRRHHL